MSAELACYGDRNSSNSRYEHGDDTEEPDLDVSSIVTELVPLEDAFIPYYDAPEDCELQNAELLTSLEDSLNFDGFSEGMRGFVTSTPRPFSIIRGDHEQPEIARAGGHGEEDHGSDTFQGMDFGEPQVRLEGSPLGQEKYRQFQEESEQRLVNIFVDKTRTLMADAEHARSIKCFVSKIPKETPEDDIRGYLLHTLLYPSRRPQNTLLSGETISAAGLEEALVAALDTAEEPCRTRRTNFRMTLKNCVHNLNDLSEIIRCATHVHRGHVDVTISPVKGRMTFNGFNGNSAIRISEPIKSFLPLEKEAREVLNALFQVNIDLSLLEDPTREVRIHYYDMVQVCPTTGQYVRNTEVNLYHEIHPAAPVVAAAPPPPAAAAAPSPSTSPSRLPSLLQREQEWQLQQQHRHQQHLQHMQQMQQLQQSQHQQQQFHPLHLQQLQQLQHPHQLFPPPSIYKQQQQLQHLQQLQQLQLPLYVSFPPGQPEHHEVVVERNMVSLSSIMERQYSVPECLRLARRYPQHQW